MYCLIVFMKTQLILLLLLFSQFTFAQTELIAYKSHSGNMEHYKLTGFDNLGEPPIYVDSILKLNDSTIVEYFSWGYANDTVVNHPICKLPQSSLDSLKGDYYNYNTRFINFEVINITDTIQKDSVIKAIKTYGESEKKKEKQNTIVPTNVENPTNTPAPLSNIIKTPLIQPKTNLLWAIVIALMFIISITIWLNQKSKLQV